jgi:phenylpropionate dioxygenase-like ring-hydroxylating dioxygenase large terminal subunit
MDHAHQVQLVRRALAHVEARTTDTDDAGPTHLPVAAYLEPSLGVFRRLPIAVGHVSQLAEPGSFFTHDLAGAPLIVTRDDAGGVVAMLNVCRHRGTRVEGAPCGTKKAFVCPYHAWSYARDGKRLGIPHERGFAGTGDRDLVRVPAMEVEGIVFVQLTGELDRGYVPFAAELAGWGIPSGHVFAPVTWRHALSWKLGIDIFLESYHLRSTHHGSIYPMFFDNIGLVDRVGPHLRTAFPKRTIRELATRPEHEWSLRHHANVLYHVFPNTLVLIEPDHAAIVHVWPDGADRAVLHAYMLLPEPPATDKARAYWDANRAILYNAVQEDLAMGESIQRGLASGANRDVVFGAFEHALAHFHAQIAAHAGGGMP